MNEELSYFKKGLYFGAGFSVFAFILAIAGYFIFKPSLSVAKQLSQKIEQKLGGGHFSDEVDPTSRIAINFDKRANPYLDKPFQTPKNYRNVYVNTASALSEAVRNANAEGGNVLISLADGEYKIKRTLNIKADNIALVSDNNKPEKVIIKANGMFKHSRATNLIKVSGDHFLLDGITLQGAIHHLIQIAGENDADYPVIRNCVMRDSYQQLLKVSYDKKGAPEMSSDFGLIEHCQFYYSAGIGPNYYIGGVDAHAGNGWIIRNNSFKDIASPDKRIAEHAIHIWNNSYNPIIINNTFEDCDRAIGLGMLKTRVHKNITYSNKGGLIKNNIIIHHDNGDPFADTGIVIEDSPLTKIVGNRVWLEHDYPRAIEYRYKSTVEVLIENNITNKTITSRDGGNAKVVNNKLSKSKKEVLKL
ncbi:right-handed parallel beta-helix repeat-containing protein [Thalassotalea psychrophila]|uniref:Right-handed parallel beta-helix repeat-containing protein n=1 Tax=Thalassotalea psychrophila TaxID=3065647 RepID=A0ABY9TW51_9GAMM|nr:right-handed parallel beta-helix repeat-containing protein [Colwelliaceae bacterium SQ149]